MTLANSASFFLSFYKVCIIKEQQSFSCQSEQIIRQSLVFVAAIHEPSSRELHCDECELCFWNQHVCSGFWEHI